MPEGSPQQEQNHQHGNDPDNLLDGRRNGNPELPQDPDDEPDQADNDGYVDQEQDNGFNHGR